MRGAALLRLGVVLAALFLLGPPVYGGAPGIAAVVLAAAAVGAGVAARERWWVLGIERAQLEEALARSCRMVLAVPHVTGDALHLRVAEAELMIRVRARGARSFELSFAGPWRTHRKAALIMSAIAKQFEPPIPRIRIRLRRAL